ncbi:hypothetical protein H9P43_002232 [Blastocladiella emersonii ATCC 22665]|nr:hypothetical protein H9P43_002232 [Blastocladiella emersonii ATCC 22665]
MTLPVDSKPAAAADIYAFDAQVAEESEFAEVAERDDGEMFTVFPATFNILARGTNLGTVTLFGDGTAETTVPAPSGSPSADVVRKGTWSIVNELVLPRGVPRGVPRGGPYIAFRSAPPTEGEIGQPQVFGVGECTEDYPSSRISVRESLASSDGTRWLPREVTRFDRCE